MITEHHHISTQRWWFFIWIVATHILFSATFLIVSWSCVVEKEGNQGTSEGSDQSKRKSEQGANTKKCKFLTRRFLVLRSSWWRSRSWWEEETHRKKLQKVKSLKEKSKLKLDKVSILFFSVFRFSKTYPGVVPLDFFLSKNFLNVTHLSTQVSQTSSRAVPCNNSRESRKKKTQRNKLEKKGNKKVSTLWKNKNVLICIYIMDDVERWNG